MNVAELINNIKDMGDKRSASALKALGKAELQKMYAQMKQDEADKEAKDETAGGDDKAAPFVTGCGLPFDAAHNSACHTECQHDMPDWYKACCEHFAKQPVKKAKATKARRGKNVYGHLINSQAEKIDRALLEEDPMTMEQLAAFADAKVARTRHHCRHLQSAWGVKLFQTIDKLVIHGGRFPDLENADTTVEFK